MEHPLQRGLCRLDRATSGVPNHGPTGFPAVGQKRHRKQVQLHHDIVEMKTRTRFDWIAAACFSLAIALVGLMAIFLM
jgi:hypothetical protein